MSVLKFREDIAAGAFVQRANTTPSSFTGVNVASSFIGNDVIRGIATVSSGTTVASVGATGVVSGNVILTGIIQYASGVASQAVVTTYAESVRTGAFEIRCIGSVAPVGDMPVGWFKIA